MSISDQITRLNNAKAAIKQSLENKGVTVSDSALLDEYPALINSIPMEGGDPYYEDLYNLRTSNGTNMASMFARTSGELDLRRLDVSNVTSMEYMFDHSSASVNIDGWDTSNVTNISHMFDYFSGSVDISKLDTSKVTNVNYMFSSANTDKIIPTGFSFPKCTKLDSMFNNATGTTLDLSSWDISNITSIYYMFSSASYKKIDLTGWKTTNVTDMNRMFYKSNNPLEELIIPDWDMTNCSHNIFYSSSYIPNLKLIDLSRSNDATIIKIASFLPTRTATTFGTVLVPENTSQATYDALIAKYWAPIGVAMTPVPTSYNIVAELDEIMPGDSTKVYLGTYEPWNADPSKVELVLVSDSSIATMTEDNEVISTGVVGDIEVAARLINTQEVISTKTIVVSETDSYPNLIKFRAASALPNNTFSTVLYVNGSSKYTKDLTYDKYSDIYSYDAGAPITSIRFDSYSYINELVKLNIDNITNMTDMFRYADFIELDLSDWDTSNVTSMYEMFDSCSKLEQLDISNWNTSNVANMTYMFQNCNKLTSLDISNFDISNVTTINYMFNGCDSLHTLRLDNCSNATISKIITSPSFPDNAISGVTRTIYCKESEAAGLTPPTNWVFSYVTEEPSIPLYVPGEFKESSVTEVVTMVNESHTDLSNMFSSCFDLTSVNTKDWDTSNVTNMSGMFHNCDSLISLDLSSFDTSNVTKMNDMFFYCNNLEELDLRNFYMGRVDEYAGIGDMFGFCDSLHKLRLDNCNDVTISLIIHSSSFPQGFIAGVTRLIYCKQSESYDRGLLPPEGWFFQCVDTGNIINSGGGMI